jgi:hypothetical protein
MDRVRRPGFIRAMSFSRGKARRSVVARPSAREHSGDAPRNRSGERRPEGDLVAAPWRSHHRRGAYDRGKARRLSAERASSAKAIVIALAIDDPALADRLSLLLGDVEGLRLAMPGELADATLVSPEPSNRPADLSQALTAREAEVLTLLAEGASNPLLSSRAP